MKTREQPVCNAEVGSLAAVNVHLGNIAFRTGEKVQWDSTSTSFLDNDRANELLTPHYRAPWKLPTS